MPFEKGKSGNPGGRPSGIRDRRTVLAELLAPDAPALVAKAVERALAGDQVLLKACLDKLVPNARPVTRTVVADEASGATTSDRVMEAALSASISLEDARSLMELLAMKARVDEVTELRERIEALEGRDEQAA